MCVWCAKWGGKEIARGREVKKRNEGEWSEKMRKGRMREKEEEEKGS